MSNDQEQEGSEPIFCLKTFIFSWVVGEVGCFRFFECLSYKKMLGGGVRVLRKKCDLWVDVILMKTFPTPGIVSFENSY